MVHETKWRSYGFGHWRRHSVPVVVWMAAVAATVWLIAQRAERVELLGIAQTEQRQIAAHTSGRLAMIPVRLLESVRAGQTLAVLEDEQVRAALATVTAELTRLRSEIAATENRLGAEAAAQQTQQKTESRRFAIDVESARLRELELRASLEADRIRLEFLELQATLMEGLYQKRAVSEYNFRLAEAECATLRKQIDERTKVLAQAERAHATARERQEDFSRTYPAPSSVDVALEPLRAGLSVQEHRIAELSLERSLLVLSSPIDGVVAELRRGVGEVVLTGEPILIVSAPEPSEVIAFAMRDQIDAFPAGEPVALGVWREGHVQKTATAYVTAAGPAAMQLPQRLWLNQAAPEWGWPVRISLPSGLRIRGGELVAVRGAQ